LRALRYIRFIASHGKNTKIPEDVKAAINDIKDLPAVSRERIRDEFLKGLKHPDVDPIHYVKMFKDLGLMETIFPDLDFKLEKSEDFSDKKEPRLALAWLLKNNTPAKVEAALKKGTWSNDEIRDIVHLIELEKWMSSHEESPEVFLDKFYDMKKKFHRTGMVPSLVKQWGKMNKMSEKILHKFLSHVMDTKGYVDEDGIKKVNPKITKYLGGKNPKGEDFGNAIKDIETDKFVKNLSNSFED
jgi:tRNA nucleotidyltransferase/poly(A) polymerase